MNYFNLAIFVCTVFISLIFFFVCPHVFLSSSSLLYPHRLLFTPPIPLPLIQVLGITGAMVMVKKFNEEEDSCKYTNTVPAF